MERFELKSYYLNNNLMYCIIFKIKLDELDYKKYLSLKHLVLIISKMKQKLSII